MSGPNGEFWSLLGVALLVLSIGTCQHFNPGGCIVEGPDDCRYGCKPACVAEWTAPTDTAPESCRCGPCLEKKP